MNLLYLEMHDDQIILATEHNVEKIVLKNFEIVHGIIFNHHAIAAHLTKFLKTHTLNKPSLIACIPSLHEQNHSLQPFITLQIALCISQTKVRLEKIISQSLSPNSISSSHWLTNDTQQTDFLLLLKNPTLTSPYTWLTITCMQLVIIGVLLIYFSTTLSQKAIHHYYEKQKQKENSEKYEKKLHEARQLEQETASLKTKLITFKQFNNQQSNPAQLFFALATYISPECWLTTVKIETHHPKGHKIISCNGITDKPQSVTSFIKKLQKSALINNLSLTSLTKSQKKHKNDQDLYIFKMSGALIISKNSNAL